MRRSVSIAGVLVLIAVVVVGGMLLFAEPSTEGVAPEPADDPELVVPEGSDSGFWAYLNARPAFEQRSPVNVIVRGDTDEVLQVMTEESDAEWDEIDEEDYDAESETFSADAVNETALEEGTTTADWLEATGSTRYAYVDPGTGDGGQWVQETMQLEDGDYYGTRYHIRLYESPNPDDEWVIMQTHTEHFDWFTLKHRVDGTEAAQSYLEADFMAHPQIDQTEDIRRIYLGNEGPSDVDGWATVVELVIIAPLLIVLGQFTGVRAVDRRLTDIDRRRLTAARNRVTARHVLLIAAVAGLLLGVRIAGILLERHATWLSMHAIAALLYPVIAVGIPIAVYGIARGLERRIDAAVTAALGLAVAIWLDYAYLSVDALPIDVVLQRALVIVALGLIAAGAARRARRESPWNEMLLVGTGLWLLLLVGTLLGWI